MVSYVITFMLAQYSAQDGATLSRNSSSMDTRICTFGSCLGNLLACQRFPEGLLNGDIHVSIGDQLRDSLTPPEIFGMPTN